MIVMFDYDGVVHAVYNQAEVHSTASSRGFVENSRVRTLCSKDAPIDSGLNHADLDNTDVHDNVHVTCVRCAALECDHGVNFEKHVAEAFNMTASEVRTRWPRLEGTCPKGCGYHGIYYASFAHYVYGDW